MNRKRKMMIGVVVVVVVCLSVVGVWKMGMFEKEENSYPMSPPNAVLNVTKTDGNYTINITHILSHYGDPYQLTSDDIRWLNISEIWVVLWNGSDCPGVGLIQDIVKGSNGGSNYTEGINYALYKLTDILNNINNNNVTYYDNNQDNMLSVNDTFVVKSGAIPNNAHLMSFYLVYKGTCQNRFNYEYVTGLGVTWWEVKV